eukprot:CCRYP_006526-RB/>CCRYP_006526-RB protein AED:0.37 eAED:0.37 QI:0/0.5/0.33/1/0/0/3/833/85
MYSLTRSEEGKLNSLLVLTSPKVLFEEASYCLLQQSSTSTLNQVVDFLDALTPSAFESISRRCCRRVNGLAIRRAVNSASVALVS